MDLPTRVPIWRATDLAKASPIVSPRRHRVRGFDVEDAIREVGVGEAVTSFLERKGIPGVAERTLIRPPSSRPGPLTPAERREVMAASVIGPRYAEAVDRESAFEKLQRRADEAARAAAEAEEAEERAEAREREYRTGRRYSGSKVGRSTSKTASRSRRSDTIGEAFAKSVARQMGTKVGQTLVRGVLGSLFRGR